MKYSDLVEQPSGRPTRKVVASTSSGAVVTVAVWGLGLLGVPVTPEVAAGLVTVAGLVAGWFRKDAFNG